jgi:hypothetical protein
MPDPAAAARLRAALVSVGGGYLRNPVRQRGVTCVDCTTPVDGYQLCLRCKGNRAHSGLNEIRGAVRSPKACISRRGGW